MSSSKVLTVSEYEPIFCRNKYPGGIDSEEHTYACLSQEEFNEFENYIDTTTSTFGDKGDTTAYFTVGRRQKCPAIIATNFVGIVQLPSGKRIEVLPKIYFGSDGNGEENTGKQRNKTRRILLKMIYSLHHYGARDYGTADLSVGDVDIFESLIRMYIDHVDRLIKRGLKSDYIYCEENERFLKGKLLLNQHIKANFAHAERFYIGYDVFDVNRPENKLVKATLELFARISVNYHNQQMIRRQLIHFELVEASVNHDHEFSKITFNRTNQEYEQLMAWSKVFLQKKSFLPEAGADSTITLLYPMEKLFESYVGQEIKRFFGRYDQVKEVHLQHAKHHLFTQISPLTRPIFRLRPDVVVEYDPKVSNTEETFVVMDTKWKNISSDASINYGISQADMYQMFAYSKKYATQKTDAAQVNCAPVWLIYPKTVKSPVMAPIVFDDAQTSDSPAAVLPRNTRVQLFFVDLEDINGSIQQLWALVNAALSPVRGVRPWAGLAVHGTSPSEI